MSPKAPAVSNKSREAPARTMKAAILKELNAPLVVDRLPIPELGVGQVLVKISHSGICGKQIDEITGKRGEDPYLPHLLGHEGAGTVVAAGPGVRKVRPGDSVVVHWIKSAGIDAASPKFQWNGVKVDAGCATTFSDYSIVAENRLTAVPADLKPEVASLLGCAVTTGLGIVFNDLGLRPGQSIAVFGVGGVGLNVLQGAALVGAHPVVAIDLHDGKLERASRFGATHTVDARAADPRAFLMGLSGGEGLDAAVDTTGDTKVIEAAFDSTNRSGRTVLAGVPRHDKRITIDSFTLHFGRRIFGSHGGGTNADADIPRYIGLYRRGALKLDELITHRFPLERINEAVDAVRKGEAGRCVVSMEA